MVLFCFETGSCFVAQGGVKLLDSSDPSTSAYQITETAGVHYYIRLSLVVHKLSLKLVCLSSEGSSFARGSLERHCHAQNFLEATFYLEVFYEFCFVLHIVCVFINIK